MFQLKTENPQKKFQSDSKWMKKHLIFSVLFLGLALLETKIYPIPSFKNLIQPWKLMVIYQKYQVEKLLRLNYTFEKKKYG